MSDYSIYSYAPTFAFRNRLRVVPQVSTEESTINPPTETAENSSQNVTRGFTFAMSQLSVAASPRRRRLFISPRVASPVHADKHAAVGPHRRPLPNVEAKIYAASTPRISPASLPPQLPTTTGGSEVPPLNFKLPTIPRFVPAQKENLDGGENRENTLTPRSDAIMRAHSPVSWKRAALKRRALSPRTDSLSPRTSAVTHDNPFHPRHGRARTHDVSFAKKSVLYRFVPKQMFAISSFADTGHNFEGHFASKKHHTLAELRAKLEKGLSAKRLRWGQLEVEEESHLQLSGHDLQEINPTLRDTDELATDGLFHVYRIGLLLL